MKYLLPVLLIVLTTCLVYLPAGALAQSPKPSIKDKTAGMDAYKGFFNFYWDAGEGKIWFEIDKLDQEFLYYSSLSSGVGSNDIGLDRGRLGDSRVMEFRRSGPKILFVEKNYGYRAVSDDAEERKAVAQAFAESVLWGFTVTAEEDDKVLVDASDFFLTDAIRVADMIKSARQGNFSVDKSRSAFYMPLTKNFPQNSEIEVTLTFTGGDAGDYLQSVSPDAGAVTVRQHHSFVRLPDNQYTPRELDPRAGYYGIEYMDFATPVDQPITKRFIVRHRLEKKDPSATMSDPVAPIVYYMDPGAPEPIRTALMEGAAWWNQAYEAAGYKNAFQVKLLPPDADPMDVRYNLIQWVHRSTRGWSYGSSIYDPRTGEILKGKVTLGSLRIRQDFLIAAGLVADYEAGKPVSQEMMDMSLQRIRQLAAHEVGHTLGLVHNYASSYNNRASVMDYPHPMVAIGKNGKLDLSQAYADGIGEWDKVAIAYGYQDFPEGMDEKEGLQQIIDGYIAKGLLFISDRDTRAAGGAHPIAHLWDNGTQAADELDRVMEVRKIALENFSEKKIPMGAPMATLEEVLVPVYMFHRYQVEAASKVLGGLYYTYAMRGDRQKVLEMVPADQQQKALEALLATLNPEALAIPEKVLALIPPYPLGYEENPREVFDSRTGITFDPIAAAEAAADFTLGFMLNPERATRMIDFHARNNRMPGFAELVDKLIAATWKAPEEKGYTGEIHRTVNQLVLDHLIALAADEAVSAEARSVATLKVEAIKAYLQSRASGGGDENYQGSVALVLSKIREYENNPESLELNQPVSVPDGSPIGAGEPYLWDKPVMHCGFKSFFK